MMREARADLGMLPGGTGLVIVGARRWSIRGLRKE